MVLTRDQINAFHKADRDLFTRLVFNLNRDVNQSLELLGFLFLLEHNDYVGDDLIPHLVSLPDASIDLVANEIVVCLNFLKDQRYSTAFFVANNNNAGHSIIPSLIRMTGGKLTLMSIHQNRDALLIGLRNIVRDICIRAFEDIIARAQTTNRSSVQTSVPPHGGSANVGGGASGATDQP